MRFTKETSLKIKGGGGALILFHHLFFQAYRFDSGQVVPWILPAGWVLQIGIAARVGVWIFAFVSAYGIATIWKNKPASKSVLLFTYERWFPLMRSFWFAYLSSVFTLFIVTGISGYPLNLYQGNPFYVLLDAAGLANFFGTPTLNGAWWYINFAQCLVLLMPVFIFVCKKFGWISFFLIILLMQYLPAGIQSIYSGPYNMYLPAVFLGVLCAQNGFFECWKRCSGIRGFLQAVSLLAVFVLGCYLRPILLSAELPFAERSMGDVAFSLAALAFCLFLFLFVHGATEKVFQFLGKHSGNIFFVHSLFIADSYLEGVIYYTHSVLGSWLTLLAISLLASILMEFVKKLVHYNGAMDFIQSKIADLLEKTQKLTEGEHAET